MLLVEKYRPTSISEFVGLEDARLDAESLVRNPYSSAWYFVGSPGIGKTCLAQAIARELGAETIHIPSQSCSVETVKQLRQRLQQTPMFGNGWWIVIVDEAEEMSPAAENAWLSLTDSTNRPANTIIIFTANGTDKLSNPDRFLSRCDVVKFSTHGLAKDATALLERIWNKETGGAVDAPNFARIVKESNNNIRESLQVLQRYIRRASRIHSVEVA